MKTVKFRNVLVASSLALCSAFAISSCDKEDDNNNNNDGNYTIQGNASGTQVVPSVSGSGSGTITGTYNPQNRTLTYTSTWANLSGAPTTASFYSGASGVTGVAVGSPWSLGTNLTATGTTSSSVTLTTEQESQLLNNGWYYSYGTTTNPSGEVRGQISATR